MLSFRFTNVLIFGDFNVTVFLFVTSVDILCLLGSGFFNVLNYFMKDYFLSMASVCLTFSVCVERLFRLYKSKMFA